MKVTKQDCCVRLEEETTEDDQGNRVVTRTKTEDCVQNMTALNCNMKDVQGDTYNYYVSTATCIPYTTGDLTYRTLYGECTGLIAELGDAELRVLNETKVSDKLSLITATPQRLLI